ncbi:MAG TPA: asparagine synthase (glutamine-hydrolyzing) [Chitinophagaceae bacterium]|jgi:asparagine synthase (glutamine-hydrolysing)|nr:asparagine synthase (glutamine-hydrolyzing) [Chitinophagaceae bacterium]
MCGLAGSINHRLDIGQLTKDLWHRGPDEQSTFEEGALQLHHHRLSIVDIAGGKQPMHHEHLTIIFNGEIYNHQEVRKKYGWTGHTSSDTETILKAYAELGPACLNEFDGMFVFIIYDRRRNSLFIAKDRAGKKPLYYYTAKRSFVFASELNALYKQVRPEINNEHIEQFLRYGAFHGSATPYKNVKELPGGHYAEVDLATASVSITRWWEILPFYENRNTASLEEAMKLTDDALHAAVKRRLESSDLEVGSFLSGGIDSGLVTAIASQYNHSLKTFTVSFTGAYDEAPLAKLVANKFNTHHTEINISFDHLKTDIEKILANYGEPFYDDSAIPSYYVSREARKHLTVILNGDGADELFGGYRRYVPFSKYDFFGKSGVLTGIAKGMKKIIPYSNQKQSKLNYLYRLVDLASQQKEDIYFSATTDIFSGFTSCLKPVAADPVKEIGELLGKLKDTDLSGLQKMMCMDFNCILPDILLVKMDIATMANSLEGRSPFLSKELLELAPGLKDEYKIKGSTTKYLLRQLAINYLPDQLINQPKRGFEVPLKQWVDNELKEIIFDYLDNNNSYADNFVDRDFIRKLLDKKVNVPDEKRAKMLYTLFALNVWHTKCVKSGN